MKTQIVKLIYLTLFMSLLYKQGASQTTAPLPNHQSEYGVSVQLGTSRVTETIGKKVGWVRDARKNLFSPSGNAGVFYNSKPRRHFGFGAEFMFQQIAGRTKHVTYVTDIFGNGNGESLTSDIYSNLSYLGIPVFCNVHINHLVFSFGFQASLMVESSGRQKISGYVAGEPIDINNKYKKLYFDIYDFGPKGKIIFNSNNRFSISSSFYYGLNNIGTNNSFSLSWKIQQITLGIMYNLHKKK